MKKRGLLALPLVFLLASCNLMVSQGDNNNTNETNNANNNNNNNNNDNNNNTNTPSVRNLLPEDSVVMADDYYESVKIGSLDLTTRKIENQESVTYDDLFNLGNRVTISIDVDDSELEKLQDDYETGYKTDIYRHCNSVTITLVNSDNTFTWTYEDVGIRQKGNTSRDPIFDNGNLKGLNHFKLSFDETFEYQDVSGAYYEDWTGKDAELKKRKDRNFLGLSGLDIKWNKNYDQSHVREIYASKLYKACGILSQDIGLCDFKFKTSKKTYNFGVCTIYEPASKALIKRHLQAGNLLSFASWKEEKSGEYGVPSENYGDLYKASYGVGEGSVDGGPDLSSNSTKNKRVGVKNFDGTYIPAYDRKTNKEVSYTDSLIKALSNKVSSGSYEDLEKLMDLDYFAVAMACNYIIGNPDDIRYNNNNYMLYFSRIDGKCYYIPIDNDRCFGITRDWNPDGNALKNRAIFDTKNSRNDKDTNTLMKKTILADGTNRCKAIYLNYVKAIKQSDFIKEETFNQFYQLAYSTYGSYTTSDFDTITFSLDDAYNLTYSNYIQAKLSKIDLAYSLNGNNNNNGQEGDYPQDVQIVGDFCGWNGTDYPLTYLGDGKYQVVLTITGNIKFKFYNNGWHNGVDWGRKKGGSANDLSLEGGDNFETTGISGTVTLTIIVDAKNLTCTWTVS